jgi:hypothetical protein
MRSITYRAHPTSTRNSFFGCTDGSSYYPPPPPPTTIEFKNMWRHISPLWSPILVPCHSPLLLGFAPGISVMKKLYRFLLQRGVPLRDVTTIDTLLGSRDLAFLGLSPIVSRAHRARQRQQAHTLLYKYRGCWMVGRWTAFSVAQWLLLWRRWRDLNMPILLWTSLAMV